MTNFEYWIRVHLFPKTLDNVEDMIMKCYVELFKKATPSADFKTLMNNAAINERGQKEIPFMDYVINGSVYDKVVEKYAKRLRPTYKYEAFKHTIALGCSPKSTNDG